MWFSWESIVGSARLGKQSTVDCCVQSVERFQFKWTCRFLRSSLANWIFSFFILKKNSCAFRTCTCLFSELSLREFECHNISWAPRVELPTDWLTVRITCEKMSVGIGLGMGQGHVTLGHDDRSDDPSSPSSSPWSIQCWDSLDHVDHLILLPERALTMDSGWLQADLAEILAQSVMHPLVVSPASSKLSSRSSGSRSSHSNHSSITNNNNNNNSKRRSLDWSLVNPTGPQSSLVALATGVSSKWVLPP